MKKAYIMIMMMIMVVTAQYAATFYIGDNGDPAAPGYGTTAENPYTDFDSALNAATTLLSEEAVTIFITAGTYCDFIELSNMNYTNPLTIKGCTPDDFDSTDVFYIAPWLTRSADGNNDYGIALSNCSNIILKDLRIELPEKAGVYVIDSNNISIVNAFISYIGPANYHNYSSEHGMIVRNSSFIAIKDCDIKTCSEATGIELFGAGASALLIDGVEHCEISDTSASFYSGPGLYVTNSSYIKAYNNVFNNDPDLRSYVSSDKYIDGRNAGMYFGDCSGIIMSGNYMRDCKYGITTYDVYDFNDLSNDCWGSEIDYLDLASPEFEAAYFDFEAGAGLDASGWQEGNGTSRAEQKGRANSAYTLRVDSSLVTSSITEEYITVEPDTLYELSANVTLDFAYDAIYLDLNDGQGQGGDFADQHAGVDTNITGQWQSVATRFRTGPATTGVKIRVVGAGLFWVDDVRIKKLLDVTVEENLGFEHGDGYDAANWAEGWASRRDVMMKRTGDFSLKVESEPVTATFLDKLLPVEPDKTYTLKGYVYVNEANSAIYLDLFGTQGTGGTYDIVQAHADITDKYNWQLMETVFTTGVDTTQLMIRIVGAGEFFVDDISVLLVE